MYYLVCSKSGPEYDLEELDILAESSDLALKMAEDEGWTADTILNVSVIGPDHYLTWYREWKMGLTSSANMAFRIGIRQILALRRMALLEAHLKLNQLQCDELPF